MYFNASSLAVLVTVLVAFSTDLRSGEPADESLTAADYIRLGLAGHDREWASQDMATAATVFSKIAEKNYRQLPRYKSKQSGAVFARLVSPQNLEIYKNKTLPLDSRLPAALSHFESQNSILKMYLAGFMKYEVTGDDLIENMGSMLRTSVVMIELTDEFIPTLDKNDPKYPVRLQGLEQMRRGMGSVIAGSLHTLTERESYRTDTLLRFTGYLADTISTFMPTLPEATRLETLTKLSTMNENIANKDLQPALGELLKKAKAAAERVK